MLWNSTMPFHASHEVMPPVPVGRFIEGSVTLRGRALDPPVFDTVARSAVYRDFLRRTQDVIVSSVGYPGGLPALIRDRERVTLRLVRLLRDD